MKIFLMIFTMAMLSGCAGTPRPMTTDLSSGMTRQEVIQAFGQPINATITDGTDYLVYQIHDHAYGRDKNYYAVGFRDGRLVSVEQLPEDQQEMGPIDRALKRKILRVEQVK